MQAMAIVTYARIKMQDKNYNLFLGRADYQKDIKRMMHVKETLHNNYILLV